MGNPLAEATTKLVDVLSPLASEERLRVVEAALTLLGDSLKASLAGKAPTNASPSRDAQGDSGLPSAADTWLKKADLRVEQLEHFFHFDGGQVSAIALPGSPKKKSDQTTTSYLVAGLASFLQTGDASFTDDQARRLCEHFGCYDVTNHSKNLKGLGNRIAGSKSTGWKLTQPGLTALAQLIKGVATS